MSWALGIALNPIAMMEYAAERGLCPDLAGKHPQTDISAGSIYWWDAALKDFALRTGYPLCVEICVVDEETLPVWTLWKMTPRSVNDFKITAKMLRSRKSYETLLKLLGVDQRPLWHLVEQRDTDLWIQKPRDLTNEQLLRVVDEHMGALTQGGCLAVQLTDMFTAGYYYHLPSSFRALSFSSFPEAIN
jgi:hypothetical protein